MTDQPSPLRWFLDVWPGEPVEVPQLWIASLLPSPPGLLAFGPPFRLAVELPIELYLRELFDLDLDDEDALRAFSAEYGLFATPGLEEISPRFREADGTSMRGGPNSRAALEARWARLQLPDGLERDRFESRSYLLTDERRVHARLLRDLVRIFRAHGRDRLRRGREGLGVGRLPRGLLEARRVERHRHALVPRQAPEPRPEAVPPAGLSAQRGGLTRGPPPLPQRLGLLAVCGPLPAARRPIAENAPSRVCQNESCRHLFVRQRGRAPPAMPPGRGALLLTRLCPCSGAARPAAPATQEAARPDGEDKGRAGR